MSSRVFPTRPDLDALQAVLDRADRCETRTGELWPDTFNVPVLADLCAYAAFLENELSHVGQPSRALLALACEVEDDPGLAEELSEAVALVRARRRARGHGQPVLDAAHIEHQREWSRKTFGHQSPVGVVNHIRKECDELDADPTDLFEWADIIILGFDGAGRAGHSAQATIDAVKVKQAINEAREWPDWRTLPPEAPVEHVRDRAAPAPQRELEPGRIVFKHGPNAGEVYRELEPGESPGRPNVTITLVPADPAAPQREPETESPCGAELIAAERRRQVEQEGWTPEHDAEHASVEMVFAAIAYLDVAGDITMGVTRDATRVPPMWPWSPEWWKPSDDPVRNLVKAGALIAAEIDRLQRLAAS